MNEALLKLRVAKESVKWRAKERCKEFVHDQAGDVGKVVMMVVAATVGLAALVAFWGDYDEGTGIAGVLANIVELIKPTKETSEIK